MAGIWRLPPYSVRLVQSAMSETMDWGLKFGGIAEAWQQTKGEGVRVAVLDTGIDASHPDLAGCIAAMADFSGSVRGTRDVQGHGTHCAGIIGARQNTVGVVGVAPECRLLCGKVLGDDGSGSSDSVAAGIDWATASGADVISMSLGSPQPSQDIARALERAVSAGKFVVCAAGNDGRPDSVDYPAAWDNLAVAVAAVGPGGILANFSSRGPQVDIAAPGVDILSTWPGGGYAKLSGTSMATPFVAGVVALLVSRHRQLGAGAATPLRNQAELIEHLHRTALDAGAPGFDTGFGFGLVNPAGLLAAEYPAAKVLIFGPVAALGYRWTLTGEPTAEPSK